MRCDLMWCDVIWCNVMWCDVITLTLTLTFLQIPEHTKKHPHLRNEEEQIHTSKSKKHTKKKNTLKTFRLLCAANHDFAPHTIPRKQFMYWMECEVTFGCMSDAYPKVQTWLHVWCMWCDVMNVMWCYVISCDVMVRDVMLRDTMPSDVMWCDVMWFDVMWCDVMWCNVMLREFMPPRVSAHLRETVKSVQELQKLLVSPQMYSNIVLYDLFCAGLESGFVPTFVNSLLQPTKRIFEPNCGLLWAKNPSDTTLIKMS